MLNCLPKNTFPVIAVFTLFALLFLEVVAPVHTLAAEGDGIIDPGEDPQAEMAKSVQNPIASLISLPFQNNTNFNFGPEDETQNVLNVQPVWPFSVSEEWNLNTRTIMPVISQPEIVPGSGRTFGLGDITFSAFLSPKDSGKLIWGAGTAIVLPTATDDVLGSDKWAAGPSVVGLIIHNKWVVGSLLNNVWSFAGSGNRDINFFFWQYFINYNLPNGWYLTNAPIITANW